MRSSQKAAFWFQMACTWRFTPRVNRLRLALFGGGSFCRSDWNLVFGPPVAGAGWDLESYYDWSAVRRLNLIKTRNEKSTLRTSPSRQGPSRTRSSSVLVPKTSKPIRVRIML